MDQAYLEEILKKIETVRVCVIGDVCLDLYWHADMKKSRLSRETPHFPLPVVRERYSLGGGGNVMANVSALGANLLPVSVLGPDWRGFLAEKCFAQLACPRDHLLRDASRVTPCYAKPLRAGISDVVYEDPRLDFENAEPLSAATEAALIAALSAAAEKADVVAVSDQLEYGVVTPAVREALCRIGRASPVVADSRDRIALYKNVIVKPNQVEAAAAAGTDVPAEAAALLRERTGAPVIVTLGENGSLWCDETGFAFVPAVKAEPPVDTVGAGDTFLAAFAAAYAAGVPGPDAIAFANLCSAVTVKKIGTTGVATPEEILQMNA